MEWNTPKQCYGPWGADGSLWCRCVSVPISKHIYNAWWSWGDHVGLALSCLISNGRLPGDSACQPPEPPVLLTSAIWAAQPHSISGARAEARAGLDPSPPGLPLALPQGMSCPLPAAHTGSEDATATAYLSLAATSQLLVALKQDASVQRIQKNLLPRQNQQKGGCCRAISHHQL